MTDYNLKLIPPEMTWPLRHRILRPHQTIQDCIFPQDARLDTFHVGAVTRDGLVLGIATFHEEVFPDIKSELPYRLRGMATDLEYHGQGIGRRVLEFGMKELKARGCDLLWCNAREIAFPFYENLGLIYFGPMFDIQTLGPHKVMYKFL